MAKPKPEKGRESEPAVTTRVLPMQLQIGDRLTDETGEYEVIGRPYTIGGGKNARVRVQKVGHDAPRELRTWGAHERISVKRVSAEEGKRDDTPQFFA